MTSQVPALTLIQLVEMGTLITPLHRAMTMNTKDRLLNAKTVWMILKKEKGRGSKHTKSENARENAVKENVRNIEESASEIGKERAKGATLNARKSFYIITKRIYKMLFERSLAGKPEDKTRIYTIMKILPNTLFCAGIGFLCNSCAPTAYTEPEIHIQHSSPDVISLYNKPSKPKPTIGGKIASTLVGGIIDGLLGSSADDDDFIGQDRYHSKKEKRDFTNKHKSSIQTSLRNKQ